MKFLSSPLAYFIYGALALYVIIALFTGNWNPFKSATNGTRMLSPTNGSRLSSNIPTIKVDIIERRINPTTGTAERIVCGSPKGERLCWVEVG